MIFGRTEEAKWAALRALMAWHRWYAWYPVQLTDGRFVWLQYVERAACEWDDRAVPTGYKHRLPNP